MFSDLLIISIFIIFPISGKFFHGNFQGLNARINRINQFNSSDFQKNYKTAEILLQNIHDQSAFADFFEKIFNPALQPFNRILNVSSCIKSRNCTVDELIPILERIQDKFYFFFTEIFKMDGQCSKDLSYHWAAVIKYFFAGKVEISCATNGTSPTCNNGTTMAEIKSILKDNFWSLIRKQTFVVT